MTGSGFVGSSQTDTKDTLCFPVQVVKERLTQARLYLLTDSLLHISETQLAELKYNIKLSGEKDSATKASYEVQLVNLNQQILLYKDQISGYERLLKRQRRKTFLTGAAGFITTGIAVYLFSQK